MSYYKTLDSMIMDVSRSKSEHKKNRELVLRHFEGKIALIDLPLKVARVVMEWEATEAPR